MNEHKLKLSKMNTFFFTQLTWENVGGLPGLAMTLRDSGKSNLSLYGPRNIQQLISATRFFLYQEKLQFECVGFTGDEEEKYEDENLTIWPVVLQGLYNSLWYSWDKIMSSAPSCDHFSHHGEIICLLATTFSEKVAKLAASYRAQW